MILEYMRMRDSAVPPVRSNQSDAGLDFLEDNGVTSDELEYCMVFIQLLSVLDDAALSLEKSGYYKHFPDATYEALVLDRRRLRNGNAR